MTQPVSPTSGAVPAVETWAMFSGIVDASTVQRLVQGLTTVSASRSPRLHLLFHSTGGYIGDGIALYNIFRAMPFPVCLYNAGSVSSIAVVAYLGARERKVSAYASFMIHRSTNTPQLATASRLEAIAQTLRLDDERTESILRQHLTLTPAQWQHVDQHDLHFSAKEAVKVGIADAVAEFSPPPGTQVFNV